MASDNQDIVKFQVLKQVEFYFSNSNLPTDKFLKEQTMKDPEGWVPLDLIASFKRMQDLTQDRELVVEALRKSEVLLTVSEDGTKIKRSIPLDADMSKVMLEINSRSVYVKGFPRDMSQSELEVFFQSKGSCKCVRMRRERGKSKTFKGSVFVEFASKEEAEKLIAQELKAPLKEGQAPLTDDGKTFETLEMMMKDAYTAKKIAAGGKPDNRLHEPKKKRKAESKPQPPKEDYNTKEFVKDLIVAIGGLENNEEASRESLREAVSEGGATPAYIDFSRGQVDGFVRLEEDTPIKGEELSKKLTEEKKTIGGQPGATFRALSGEEERKYYIEMWQRRAERKSNKRHRGRR